MGNSTLLYDLTRIVTYCKRSRSKAQIMTEMSLNEIEIEAYILLLIRHNLIEKDLKEYRTTKQGISYLETRKRVEVAFRK